MPTTYRTSPRRRVDSVPVGRVPLSRRDTHGTPHHPHDVLLASLLVLLVLIGVRGLPQTAPSAPRSDSSAIPDLTTFVSTVTDGNRKVLRGVYAEGVFALPGRAAALQLEVSTAPDTVTQFGMAQNYGVIGLLAHNWLSGRISSSWPLGSRIDLVYGDGRIETFRVTRILQLPGDNAGEHLQQLHQPGYPARARMPKVCSARSTWDPGT